MTLPASTGPRGRPHLRAGARLARSRCRLPSRTPTGAASPPPILASTWNVSRYLHEQRWGRVHEELSERRELLGWLARLPLDANGRAALRALDQAALESERAIAAMMGESRG